MSFHALPVAAMDKIPHFPPPSSLRQHTPPARAARPSTLNIAQIENRLASLPVRIEGPPPTRAIHDTIASFRAASPPQVERYRPAAMRLEELAKVLPDLMDRAPLASTRIRQLLLACIALNAEHALVSADSERLLLEALNIVRGSEVPLWRSGERPYEVLSVFLMRVRELRPHLF